jgi:hypothetical protein
VKRNGVGNQRAQERATLRDAEAGAWGGLVDRIHGTVSYLRPDMEAARTVPWGYIFRLPVYGTAWAQPLLIWRKTARFVIKLYFSGPKFPCLHGLMKNLQILMKNLQI